MKGILVGWLFFVGALSSPFAVAHSGGIDTNGGHIDSSINLYHCHSDDCILPSVGEAEHDEVTVVSFNIQFLGNPKKRDNKALAALVAPYDVVLVQELVAPPYQGTFPDSNPYRPDKEAKLFFDAMLEKGFDYILSEEDTGTGNRNHLNSTATEWWVAFYKPNVIEPAESLPHGFLQDDRTNHESYERVPYAFALRTVEAGNDFVLISVHLKPNDDNTSSLRRQEELAAIALWVDQNDDVEKDFFIIGDMNFKNCEEITTIKPVGFGALNVGDNCYNTNTSTNGKPYDNVLFNEHDGLELSGDGNFEVIDLITAMQVPWFETSNEPYPGQPYHHNKFRARYSDHHPVLFKLRVGVDDD